MNILSIETSCDETAISVVEALGDFPRATYTILGDALRSQIEIHREYGGVLPSLAKRDHAGAIVSLMKKAFTEAEIAETSKEPLSPEQVAHIQKLLEREEGLADQLIAFYEHHSSPTIDMIAVTAGPGLEPALWVGVNFAKALAYMWNVPVVATNHLEGHILASVYEKGALADVQFPALSLLISGGHTEFILMEDWSTYQKVGQTRDDAIGEAFDKVARLLGLPYPGGPEIDKLTALAQEKNLPQYIELPRPMLDSGDLDVSFSGIKTAVRYAVTDKELTLEEKAAIAREFQEAVTEVLLKKAKQAVDLHGIKSLIIGGGVSANKHIRNAFATYFEKEYPELTLYLPDPTLSTDNSIMIALAGHAHKDTAQNPEEAAAITAEGNKPHRRIPVGAKLFEEK